MIKKSFLDDSLESSAVRLRSDKLLLQACCCRGLVTIHRTLLWRTTKLFPQLSVNEFKCRVARKTRRSLLCPPRIAIQKETFVIEADLHGRPAGTSSTNGSRLQLPGLCRTTAACYTLLRSLHRVRNNFPTSVPVYMTVVFNMVYCI